MLVTKKISEIFKKMNVLFLGFLLVTNMLFIMSISSFDEENESMIIESFVTNYSRDDIHENIHYFFGKSFTWRENYQIYGESIKFSDTGNCYFSGIIKTEFLTKSDIVFGKLNQTGSLEWINRYDYQDRDFAYDLILDDSYAYIVGATLNNSRIDYYDLFIGCFDLENGTEIWAEEYGQENNSEIGYSILIEENSLYIAGIESQYIQLQSQSDIFLIKLNSTTGNVDWSYTYTTTHFDEEPLLTVNKNSQLFYLVHHRKIAVTNEELSILQKIAFDGTIISEFLINDLNDLKINDILIDEDNNQILLLGDFWEGEQQKFRDTAILFLDSDGNRISQLIYGKEEMNEVGYAFEQKGNNIIFAGASDSDFNNDYVAFFVNITRSGMVVWEGKNEVYLRSLILDLGVIDEGKIAMTGYCEGRYDFVFHRLFCCYTIDEDADGLSRYYELEIGTNPEEEDTDKDGFSDGDEIRFNTDPLNKFNNLSSRFFWNNFSIVSFFIIIVFFIAINLLFYTKRPKDEKTLIVKFYEKIINSFKKI